MSSNGMFFKEEASEARVGMDARFLERVMLSAAAFAMS
jgi:hypothetical protein